jgi:DNA-binding NarL/FixJ family response regulator
MRVLIVEDDAIVAMHLAMLLTEVGHETRGTAASAATAIAQAAKYEPDIVLMDIRLAQAAAASKLPESFTPANPCDAFFSVRICTSRQKRDPVSKPQSPWPTGVDRTGHC